jgi:hypothetical protein
MSPTPHPPRRRVLRSQILMGQANKYPFIVRALHEQLGLGDWRPPLSDFPSSVLNEAARTVNMHETCRAVLLASARADAACVDVFDPGRAFTPFCEAHYIAVSSFIEIDHTVCFVSIMALSRDRSETLDLYASPDDEEPIRLCPVSCASWRAWFASGTKRMGVSASTRLGSCGCS